ncbi:MULTISPECIES: hypothetical protein [unclassified Polaromonas]|uniref:hypothetical protein n=1 Tax=unclassified Polaromonas TaxID=2638319 RepID=UPI000F08B07F|nr:MULTISPECIES: hypothetical protein [unclassified Polaromonas]AYQ28776.1 hypothetical protein DT070_12505 [Polaromonas sp. SP1]QGJ20109.1 hypothetical protein F7R28_18095 [Polaromonas sp. Pch-P]
MIFAVATDECTLTAFESEAAAVVACEGLDVEAADWLFWDDCGRPLEPLFSIPNKRGFFMVQNGVYSLVPATPNHHADLDEALDEVRNFESPAPFNSAEGVRAYLARKGGSNEV